MKVRQIIEEKAIQETYTIKASDTVNAAANKLSTLGVGALLVSDDGNKIDGIMTERDIVKELGKSGSPCLKMSVGEIMTKDVQTIPPDLDARDALEKMSNERFRHLPVVDGNQLVGILSIGDAVSARLREIESENSALNEMISGSVF